MKLACIGAQNTGKTTFIADMIETYPQFMTPRKTYRDIIRKYGLKINQNATIAGQWIIFCTVLATVNTKYKKAVIFDRTPFDAYIYTLYVAGSPEGLEEMRTTAIQALKEMDMVFLFPLAGNEHLPLKADGLRDIDENYREKIDALFHSELASIPAEQLPPIHRIAGERHDRVALVAELLGLSSSVVMPKEIHSADAHAPDCAVAVNSRHACSCGLDELLVLGKPE